MHVLKGIRAQDVLIPQREQPSVKILWINETGETTLTLRVQTQNIQ
jgi:hypothetical protein